RLADDERQLRLVVPLAGELRIVGDRVARSDHGVGSLGEERRALREVDLLALALADALEEVVEVVPPRTEHVALEAREGGEQGPCVDGDPLRCRQYTLGLVQGLGAALDQRSEVAE